MGQWGLWRGSGGALLLQDVGCEADSGAVGAARRDAAEAEIFRRASYFRLSHAARAGDRAPDGRGGTAGLSLSPSAKNEMAMIHADHRHFCVGWLRAGN